MTVTARVQLWDQFVGALIWDEQNDIALFEYDPAFVKSGLEIAPIHMPLRAGVTYEFGVLSRDTYKGLPAVLADSLPDDFGNALINAWLAQQGRDRATFSPVERLLYIGARGMGALEYKPSIKATSTVSESIQISALVQLASQVLSNRESLADRLGRLDPAIDDAALQRLIHVGTSAGGARAKALIAMNDQGQIRSGQVKAPKDFSYWLLKFDVAKSTALLADSQGYGRIEYAYSLMARKAGITMAQCRLLEEGGRAHFMTRRFDRDKDGGKLHMQTLCAMDHADFAKPGQYSYEEGFAVLRRLSMSREEATEFYRRMVFNVIARNQDNHTKNIAFLMDQNGKWRLSPAYDLSWSYLPGNFWVDSHQMTINGKRDQFDQADLQTVALQVKGLKADPVIDQVMAAVKRWPDIASAVGVTSSMIDTIARSHRLYLDAI
ncbi:MAG: type II toxin-antitoxin system HipA family toxin [Janthinobacterium lividum]